MINNTKLAWSNHITMHDNHPLLLLCNLMQRHTYVAPIQRPPDPIYGDQRGSVRPSSCDPN